MSEPSRPSAVRLRWGGATDVGQARTVNQDSMLLGPDVFVVADGMGGHQGGEVASALAVEAVEAEAPGPSVAELIAAVQTANETVFIRSTEDPALSGMGTTLVAVALVVEGGEQRIAIVNVGDSRAYRLSGGELTQITQDHSLVGELVREGRISPEEAEVHPQRNIVTRVIGIDESIPVDDFQILPKAGDRYLLCSDGLTNEVAERDIAVVLRQIDDPDDAARELVRRANEHGGRDNITVVIVDVVDDGDLSSAASAAVEGGMGASQDDTAALMAIPDDQAHVAARPVDEARAAILDDTDAADTGDAEPVGRQRAVTVRSVAFVVLVLAIVGGGLFLVNDYARNTYTVTVVDDEVTILRGRPGGFLWFDPTLAERTGVDADDLPAEFRDDVVDGVSQPSLARAQTYVRNIEERIEELAPPPTTTTTSTSSTTSTTSTPTTAATTPAN